MTVRVQLHGDKFDGLVCEVHEMCVTVGLVVVYDCPTHGSPGGHCLDCDDAMAYGYFPVPGKGCGFFSVLGVGSDLSQLPDDPM